MDICKWKSEWAVRFSQNSGRERQLTVCSNWKAITLMPLASKVLSKILINRIRCGIDYTDQIFILNNILEQASEWNATCIMYIHFWTLRKHSTWCPEMEKYGIPPKKLIKMLNALYDVFSALRLRTTRYKVTAPFSLMTGVKQGCCISGFLFLFSIIIIDCVMQQTVKKEKTGIRLNFTSIYA